MVELPSMSDLRVRVLSVCGHVATNQKSMLAKLRSLAARKEPIVAELDHRTDSVYIVLFGGGSSKFGIKHMHIDFVRRSEFAKKPKVNSDTSEVLAFLEFLEGVR